MLAYQQRATDEALQLQERIGKLEAFLAGAATLDPVERSLMQEQAEHMRAYFNVLSKRIGRFHA